MRCIACIRTDFNWTRSSNCSARNPRLTGSSAAIRLPTSSPAGPPISTNSAPCVKSISCIIDPQTMRNASNSLHAPPKAWLAWSSGKDSAWALHTVRQSGEFEIVAMLTTVNRTHERVAMHAVRESLLEMQAAAAGLPLVKVPIPSPCPNEIYEQAMSEAMTRARTDGVRHVIFGDLFLEDVRAYREKQLARCEMIPVFPLWGRNTRQLAEDMLAAGLSAFL